MKTAKIDLDEIERDMRPFEGDPFVLVRADHLTAMIRAIRAAIAVEDETREMGECPFGEDASGALRPFRKDGRA